MAGRANIGNYVYNNVQSNTGVYAGAYHSTGYLTNRSNDALVTKFNNWNYFSDYYIQDASFLRIDNISVGYQLRNLFEDVNLHLSMTVQNALVLTKYTGLDPEVFGGIDNVLYPRPRVFLIGVNLEF